MERKGSGSVAVFTSESINAVRRSISMPRYRDLPWREASIQDSICMPREQELDFQKGCLMNFLASRYAPLEFKARKTFHYVIALDILV